MTRAAARAELVPCLCCFVPAVCMSLCDDVAVIVRAIRGTVYDISLPDAHPPWCSGGGCEVCAAPRRGTKSTPVPFLQFVWSHRLSPLCADDNTLCPRPPSLMPLLRMLRRAAALDATCARDTLLSSAAAPAALRRPALPSLTANDCHNCRCGCRRQHLVAWGAVR